MKTASMVHSDDFPLRQQPLAAAHAGLARQSRPLLDSQLIAGAVAGSFRKLNPATLIRNPVIFVVEVGAALTTAFMIRDAIAGVGGVSFELQIAIWLWFTVLFANFAEAIAEARGKAQADTLRKSKADVIAKLVGEGDRIELVPSSKLRSADVVLCEAGDTIPGDGEVIEGIATVDESVITGESAPVIRESGGDRSAVTGGTRVLSDWIKVRITANPGESFLDRMIALVEGAERRKTPNEIALDILIAGLSLIFLLSVATLLPFAAFTVTAVGAGAPPTVPVLVALLVCLIPTTIGGLLSAIGIAGMDRLVRYNVLAMSGRAVEAAGDVNTLLLDKTGTITLGNRQAVAFLPVSGIAERELADAAQLASLADETPEGRSIVVLAKQRHNLRGRDVREPQARFIPFSAYTRMSGVDMDGVQLRKGATDAVVQFVREHRGKAPAELFELSERVARSGGTPLAVADGARALGIIHLKDVVKGGIEDRVSELRAMGIRTVMVTGDNPLTAAAIAEEAGVDDFIAQATPREKLEYIRKEQGAGKNGRDGRRRHQRCSRAGPGRRRTGDEHRHGGSQGSRQHGGPRQQSHQAHRSRENREAIADHPGRPDNIFDRQRCGQVLRHYPGPVHGDVSGSGSLEHHGTSQPPERDPRGGDLQRADHHRPGSSRVAGRRLPAAGSGQPAAPQPADLRSRRRPGALPRHLDHRPDYHAASPCLTGSDHVATTFNLISASSGPHRGDRIDLSGLRHGTGPAAFQTEGGWEL